MFFNLAEKNDFRYERKYFISDIDSRQIDLIVKRNQAFFSEIFHERRINNIYLDTGDLKHYFDNKDGISKRAKVRIRWYGETFGKVNNPVLEIKLKNNLLGTKLIYKLSDFSISPGFSKKYLDALFDSSDLPLNIREILKSYNLSLLNSYVRKYYLSLEKDIRATVDNDLSFFEIQQNNNLFLNNIKNKEDIILELKYDLGKEKSANNVARHLPFTPTKSSKYIYGYDKLNGLNI